VGREGSLNEDVVMSCILAGSGKVSEQGRTSQTVKPTVIQGQTAPTTIICTFEATLGSGIGFTAMSGSCRLDKQGWGYGRNAFQRKCVVPPSCLRSYHED